MEVVDENRAQISVSPLLKEDDIPKTVFKPSSSSSSKVPSLIPLTVSEIDETESKLTSQSLHMSGGGVYTTDSFFCKYEDTTYIHYWSSRERNKTVCKRANVRYFFFKLNKYDLNDESSI